MSRKQVRRYVTLFLSLILVLVMPMATNQVYAATKITLKSGAAAPSTIYAGHVYNLKVAGQSVKFYSSNKKVATIGITTGTLKPVAPGTVKITAKNAKTGKAVASKTFTVLKRATSVEADSEVILEVGEAYNIQTPVTDSVSTPYQGVIIREEAIYTADFSGEVDFFASKEEWVSKNSMIASIDASGNLWSRLHEIYFQKKILSDESIQKIEYTIHRSAEELNSIDFRTVSGAKSNIQSTIFECLLKDGKESVLSDLSDLSYSIIEGQETGFFLNWMDGYEVKNVENLVAADFSKSNYNKTIIISGAMVQTSDFLYKIAKDNKFQIAFLLSQDEADHFSSSTALTILMDGIEMTGDFKILQTLDGRKMGVLTFAKYGANFLDNRFVSFQILNKKATGYKIPESAVVKKDFFVVPSSYITKGGASNHNGVLLEVDGKVKFFECTVYEQTEDSFVIGDDVCYIYSDSLYGGDILHQVGGNETMTLGLKATVEGVYQVNHGYCIFKPIVRTSSSIESSFILVKANAKYSLVSYDRIVLNTRNVKENEIIYE